MEPLALYNKWKPKISRLVKAYPKQWREDLYQEAFLAVTDCSKKEHTSASYIHSYVRGRLHRYYKKMIAPLNDQEYVQLDETVDTEFDHTLIDRVLSLSHRDADIVIRHAYFGETFSEICNHYSFGPERARQLYHRALERLNESNKEQQG